MENQKIAKAQVHVVADRASATQQLDEQFITHFFGMPLVLSTDSEYVVMHHGLPVEFIHAHSYDEAAAHRTVEYGTLYRRCGGHR